MPTTPKSLAGLIQIGPANQPFNQIIPEVHCTFSYLWTIFLFLIFQAHNEPFQKGLNPNDYYQSFPKTAPNQWQCHRPFWWPKKSWKWIRVQGTEFVWQTSKITFFYHIHWMPIEGPLDALMTNSSSLLEIHPSKYHQIFQIHF